MARRRPPLDSATEHRARVTVSLRFCARIPAFRAGILLPYSLPVDRTPPFSGYFVSVQEKASDDKLTPPDKHLIPKTEQLKNVNSSS